MADNGSCSTCEPPAETPLFRVREIVAPPGSILVFETDRPISSHAAELLKKEILDLGFNAIILGPGIKLANAIDRRAGDLKAAGPPIDFPAEEDNND
jgi:hypothetical protein